MLTRGASGMTLLKDGAAIEQPALRVAVVDTVGCGDAAMGGWMAGVLGDAPDLAAQARLASAAAAVAATRAGAYPPLRQEVDALLAATAGTPATAAAARS